MGIGLRRDGEEQSIDGTGDEDRLVVDIAPPRSAPTGW
jgi:hypothetical protein